MANQNIYQSKYINTKCNRGYEIWVFLPNGTDVEPVYSYDFDTGTYSDNIKLLPIGTLTLNTINWAEFGDEVYGVPEDIYADLSLNISNLDVQGEHKEFVDWFINPNKYDKKPVVVIKEHTTHHLDPNDHNHGAVIDLFTGIIAKGISGEISKTQTIFEIKAEHFLMYTLRTTPILFNKEVGETEIKDVRYNLISIDDGIIIDGIQYPAVWNEYYNSYVIETPYGLSFILWDNIASVNYVFVRQPVSVKKNVGMSILDKVIEEYSTEIRRENRPFGYWMHYIHNGTRKLLLDMPIPLKHRPHVKSGYDKSSFISAEIDKVVGSGYWGNVYELGNSSIFYVNLSNMLQALGKYIKNEAKLNIQNFFYIGDLRFGDIIYNTPYEYYKQNYGNQSGNEIKWSSNNKIDYRNLFVKRKVIYQNSYASDISNPLTIYDFTKMTADLRITSLIDFLHIMCNSFLVRMQFLSNRIDINQPKNEDRNGLISIKDSSPVNIDKITINEENPLNNIDCVYLGTTPDEIKNVRYNLQDLENITSEKSLTIQYLFNNQMPNNAYGWTLLENGVNVTCKRTENHNNVNINDPEIFLPGKYRVWWGMFGSHEPASKGNKDGKKQYLEKSGSSGNYTLWYFDNIKNLSWSGSNVTEANALFDIDMPYFAAQQNENINIDFDENNVKEIVANIQNKASQHLQTSDNLKKTWFKDKHQNHYKIKIEIPLVMLEKELTNVETQYLTNGLHRLRYSIDIKTLLGNEIPKDNWIVINYRFDYEDGIAELELINRSE